MLPLTVQWIKDHLEQKSAVTKGENKSCIDPGKEIKTGTHSQHLKSVMGGISTQRRRDTTAEDDTEVRSNQSHNEDKTILQYRQSLSNSCAERTHLAAKQYMDALSLNRLARRNSLLTRDAVSQHYVSCIVTLFPQKVKKILSNWGQEQPTTTICIKSSLFC